MGKRSVAVRRSVLVVVVLVASVLAVRGAGLGAAPVDALDPGAWLSRGRDLVHASAVTGVADWLVPDVVGGEGTVVAQDGERAVVVDGDRAFSVDPVNLGPSGAIQVEAGAVPFVRGDQVYLVADGVVRWLDPVSLEQRRAVAVPGRADAEIDRDGNLWVLTPRDGVLRRVREGAVQAETSVVGAGARVELTLAGNRPVAVLHDQRRVAFVDPARVRVDAEVAVPATGLVQGGSWDGDRVWMAVEEAAELVGVRADGDAVRIDVGHRPLRRPEVVGERVFAFAGNGTVTVVDARRGVRERTSLVEAARERDFTSFVKDGRLWFNAAASRVSGTIAGDGEVATVQEDRQRLARTARDAPRPNDVTSTTVPPSSRRADAGTGRSRPPASNLRVPSTPPAPTTSAVPGPVVVPPFDGKDPDAYCAELAAAGLRRCETVATGAFGARRQVEAVTPAPGTAVAPDTVVRVSFVDAGRMVPNVSAGNLNRQEACAALRSAGLQCQENPAPSPRPIKPSGVWGQSVAAGTYVGVGQQVGITFDPVEWVPLYQCDDTARDSKELKVSTDAACSWSRTSLGVVARTQAPGTVPLFRWEASRDHLNVSDMAWTVEAAGRGAADPHYDEPTVLGYVYRPDSGLGGRTVFHYVKHSDRYYSLNDRDPIGMGDYWEAGQTGTAPSAWETW